MRQSFNNSISKNNKVFRIYNSDKTKSHDGGINFRNGDDIMWTYHIHIRDKPVVWEVDYWKDHFYKDEYWDHDLELNSLKIEI